MIKILVLYPPSLDNVGYWRFFRPLDVMRRLYPGVFDITYKAKDLNFGDIISSDVIITRRPWGDGSATLIELLQTARMPGIEKPVIFDEDDFVTACPETHELYATTSDPKFRVNYVEALKCASAFWFSTPAFLETIHPEGTVIPNAVLPTDIPDEPAPDMGLYGWQGKSIQAHDLIEAGYEWYREHGMDDRIKQWIWFGWKPPLPHGINSTGAAIPYMPNVYAYVNSFKKRPDIGLNGINCFWKPLIQHPFNDHKSNLSLLTATIGGGYCLSNYAGRPGWEFASKDILSYSDACELWRAAKDDVLQNYNLETTARMRAESIFSLLPQFINQMA